MPTWLIHIVSWIHKEHRASRDVGAFARESCILVANKIRVGESASYALCSRELGGIKKVVLTGS